MIIINAPLKQETFQKYAEDEGLVFRKKSGMKLFFDNPEGEDGKKAEVLKKKLKGEKELAAIYFSVQAQ
ncbi:hypothetical protein [Lacrimispora defluvii]|uniref:Uncharacterized protein n=1 Tax=Lacrimispora defluvii TaxID=2719233 RepID=A0ABX1VV03_9FIRM|nr:hypothetical protein [Lacrimispora defluvii]NNJ31672.1 hypothetical protein [Lacrimispora defluvii]